MVRSHLIENRICFDSDSGSGGAGGGQPDRFNPAEMRAREQRAENRAIDIYNEGRGASDQVQKGSAEARDLFAGGVDRGLQDPDSAVSRRKASEDAALRQQAMTTTMGQGSDRGVDMAAMAPVNNAAARQRLAEQLAVANAYRTPTIDFKGNYLDNPSNLLTDFKSVLGYNTPKVALDTLQAKAGQFMMPRIDDALQRPGMSPVYGYGGRVTGAANEFGQLIEGTDPMNTLGGRDDEGSFGDGDILPPVDDATEVAGGVTGEIPSDELAINYLRNPYYAYSGFGNQYQPYGFAPTTMVDLLQSRGMTQPQQADTLGLFGNPRDFV
jgi:hypothetical protein